MYFDQLVVEEYRLRLIRLFIKICKHIFISLRYADPRLLLRKSFGGLDPSVADQIK